MKESFELWVLGVEFWVSYGDPPDVDIFIKYI